MAPFSKNVCITGDLQVNGRGSTVVHPHLVFYNSFEMTTLIAFQRHTALRQGTGFISTLGVVTMEFLSWPKSFTPSRAYRRKSAP